MAISIYSFDIHVIAELASGFILMVFIVLNLTVVVSAVRLKHNGILLPVPTLPLPQIYGTVAGIFMLVLMEEALFGGGGASLASSHGVPTGNETSSPEKARLLNAFLSRDGSG